MVLALYILSQKHFEEFAETEKKFETFYGFQKFKIGQFCKICQMFLIVQHNSLACIVLLLLEPVWPDCAILESSL